MITLLIDNYDSFTYNLYHYITEINGVEPIVICNNTYSFDEIMRIEFDNIIISPGPGNPNNPLDFGICAELISKCSKPILGICLGHQGIGSVFGAKVIHAEKPIHGQISLINHNDDPIFLNIPKVFNAVRYHSLILNPVLPECLTVIAETTDNVVMGAKHKSRPIWGIQYHPESICTEHGKTLLRNFMKLSKVDRKRIKTEQISTIPEKPKFKLSFKKIAKRYDHEKFFTYRFKQEINAVWLDSSKIISGFSRFSIMGCLDGPLSYLLQYNANNKEIFKTKGEKKELINMSIFDYLQIEIKKYAVADLDLPFQFYLGFVGYLGYELYSETLNIANPYKTPHPDAQFIFLDRALVFDGVENCCYLLKLSDIESDVNDDWFEVTEKSLDESQLQVQEHVNRLQKNKELTYTLRQDKHEYLKSIDKCLEYINDGESYEICLTNNINFKRKINGLDYYLKLRKVNKAPYAAYLKFNDLEIASASIERYLYIDSKGYVETKPIKGTLPRGGSLKEDLEMIDKLQTDIKFRSENLMIVDLLRNDLSRVCEVGSVKVNKLMHVESYETLHQLVSTIHGKLKTNYTAIDCIKASFPGGSMTGAPKIRTVELLKKIENNYRNIYSGSIGYLSLNGAIDLNIVIRTALITKSDVNIGVGGAIIALSDPNEEFLEILLKSKSLQSVI